MSVLNFTLSAGRKLLASAPAPSPTGYENTGLSSPYANKGALESDLVVVLAAMICALICALGLNSWLSCLFRCMRRMPVDSSEEAIRLGNIGVKKAAMKALPIIVYTSASKLPPGLATDCSICLAEFREEENLRVLPKCNHGFHVECIDKWLTSHSSCPLCRHSLNLVNRNEKSGGAAIAQATVSSCNAMHVAIETTDSTQTILSRSETLERSSQEATEVTASSPLPPSSVSENQSSCHAVNNVG